MSGQNGNGQLSEADKEIVKLAALGFEAAMLKLADQFRKWLGTMVLKALVWAGGIAACALILWAATRSMP